MEHDLPILSKSAQSVQDALAQQGLPLKIVELNASARTVPEVARAIGCEVAQVVQSLIFCTKDSWKPVLVLVSGDNQIDIELLSNYVGVGVIKADADFARDVTGFAIGGIPPIGHKQQIVTYIDKDLLLHDQVWAAAGAPNTVFSLPSSELASLTQGTIVVIQTLE